jgi:hypothetical protein
MIRLRGHFNGQHVVLDQPTPEELEANTPVEVVILESRERALSEMEAFLDEFWARPMPPGIQVPAKRWRREDLYERG